MSEKKVIKSAIFLKFFFHMVQNIVDKKTISVSNSNLNSTANQNSSVMNK